MAKVQFNCRLNPKTIEAINLCAARYSDVLKRKVSQAEVIERTFDGQLLPATVHSSQPRKLALPHERAVAVSASSTAYRRGIRAKGDKQTCSMT